ncbi:transposase [Luteolibacter rhizosphaerae]|nr:transposase [Luteolibacter rhizosphaerae]
MPNHVHALISMEGRSLGSIVQTWKGASAAAINKQLDRRGTLWMPDYHDRFIRDADHFHDARIYIRRNPVKAGLCLEPQLWPLSSAGTNWNPEAGAD